MKVVGGTPKQRLQSLASAQQGFFTSRQATSIGYAYNNFSYHVGRKNWIRERRGIYRLARMPRAQEADYVIWSLWSMDDSLSPQGVFSHDTALELHGGSDILPSKFHLTVPRTFKRRRQIKGLVLYRADLEKEDTEARDGYRITTPLRTLIDCVQSQRVQAEMIVQALASFLREGRISLDEVKANPQLESYLSQIYPPQETDPALQLVRQYFAKTAPEQKLSDEELRDLAQGVATGVVELFGLLQKGWEKLKESRQRRKEERARLISERAQSTEAILAERIKAKGDPGLLQLWKQFKTETASERKS